MNPGDQMNEVGFYTLAGAPDSPRDLIEEVQQAEALGIGACFISERFHIKEACTISGAVAAVSERIGIATAATNQNTRHAVVTAGFSTTMHALSGGRFSLGLGRGIDRAMDAMGLPRIKTAAIEEFVLLMRRMFRGAPIPLVFTAFGPNSLALGGRVFDAVVLHTFFTDETTARAVKAVKTAAEEAGRNPDDVRVWSCFATLGDHLPPEVRLKKTVGRMATYLQAYGDLMVRTNRWDPVILQRFRDDELVRNFRGALDSTGTTAQL